VILGFSQAICKRIGDDDSLSMPLRSIEREALRCKNLVADLLAFSRKSSENPSPVDVCKIIESTLVLVTNQARLNSIEVISECAVNLPEILADFNGLQQVLVNLSTNAIDAMQAGGTLRYEARNSDSSLTIRVTDTGTGMSSEVRERIFEPFFTTKEFGKGTGLGLSLVYEIVKQYGGSIECLSEIGSGSTFTLTFPLHRS
jgi:signal transduction histidine kinase